MSQRLILGITDAGKAFTLPADLVSQSTAILAKRRVGKSYLASVIAEELLTRGQPVVIVDPTGAHWGLRASADGRKPGFPVVVVGGRHADLPLEEGGGEALARAVVEQRFSLIVDTSLLTKGATLRFLDAFLGTLYQANEQNLLLLLDEVDYYCPQKPASPQHAITAAHVDDLVRRGGIKGIGVVLVTQRSAVVSKDVLTQCEVLIALRLVHPLDIKPIMDWVGVHGDQESAKRMLASLPSLPVGTAWVWWPAEEIFERIQVRKKTTFDSGRTPKPGERGARPKVLAKVDLAQLGERMKSAAEQAKANDPRELKKQLAAASARIKALEARKSAPAPKAASPVPRTEVKTVQVPVLKEAQLKRLEQLLKNLGISSEQLLKELLKVGVAQTYVLTQIEKSTSRAVTVSGMRPAELNTPTPTRITPPAVFAPVEGLSGPEVRVLASLAWWKAMGVSLPGGAAVAVMARYTVTSSSYEKPRAQLKAKGLLTLTGTGQVSLTDAGEALAPPVSAPTTREELHRCVLGNLKGPERRLLGPLLEAYPEGLTNATLAERSRYAVTSSSYEKPRAALVALGLATLNSGLVRAADFLFPA